MQSVNHISRINLLPFVFSGALVIELCLRERARALTAVGTLFVLRLHNIYSILANSYNDFICAFTLDCNDSGHQRLLCLGGSCLTLLAFQSSHSGLFSSFCVRVSV